MKFLSILFLMVPLVCISQNSLEFGSIPKANDTYDSYITRDGNTIEVGDKIFIDIPSTADGFQWITQGGSMAASFLAGVEVEISKIRTYKNRFAGKAYLEFKGYGLVPLSIDYETALRTGEIEAPSLE